MLAGLVCGLADADNKALCGAAATGEWVALPAHQPKSFDACVGPYDPTIPLKAIPLRRPDWVTPFLPTIGAISCACDYALRNRTAGRRPSERYTWQPHSCHMHAWSAEHFCKHALGQRRLLIVGDSTLLQFAWTLWNLVRGVCDDRIEFSGADTLVGGCLGNRGFGSTFENIFRTRLPTPPDVVVLGAGAHVFKERCHFAPFKASGCFHGPMRCTHSSHEHFKRAKFNLANTAFDKLNPQERAQLLASYDNNLTEQLEAMQMVLNVTVHAARAIRRDFGRNGTQPPEIIWKSSSPAHQNCVQWGPNAGPQVPFAGYVENSTDFIFNWAAFPHFDRMARSVAESSDGALHFMDVSMLYERPDGHSGTASSQAGFPVSIDCLHYCTPGPIDDVARLLQHVLLTRAAPRTLSWPPPAPPPRHIRHQESGGIGERNAQEHRGPVGESRRPPPSANSGPQSGGR